MSQASTVFLTTWARCPVEMEIEPNSNRTNWTRTHIMAEPNRTRTEMQKNMQNSNRTEPVNVKNPNQAGTVWSGFWSGSANSQICKICEVMTDIATLDTICCRISWRLHHRRQQLMKLTLIFHMSEVSSNVKNSGNSISHSCQRKDSKSS